MLKDQLMKTLTKRYKYSIITITGISTIINNDFINSISENTIKSLCTSQNGNRNFTKSY